MGNWKQGVVVGVVVVLVGLINLGSVRTLAMPVEPVAQGPADSSLTIIFGRPSEFATQSGIAAHTVAASPQQLTSLSAPQGKSVASSVPEPSAMALIGIGVLALWGLRRGQKCSR